MDGYTLITGATGSGKSLFAVDLLRGKFFEGRPLYVSGVPGLKLVHQKLDPNEQETGGDLLEERTILPLIDLPLKSVVFIDECQRVFPPRSATKTPPPNVRYFEVRRKLAHDGILVTQHPNLLDPNVRKLVNRHIHIVRTLGLQRASVYEWNKCKDPDSKADLKLALRRGYTYPKDVYKLYKSAEIHTVKPRIPKLVFVIPLLIIVGILSVWSGVAYMQKKTIALGAKDAASSSTGTNSTPSQRAEKSKASYLDAVGDAKQFVFERTPRVEGLAYTAPRYDRITEPTIAPVPVACVNSSQKCRCYSQQGTPLQVPLNQCLEITYNGFFRDFKDHVDESSRRSSESSGELRSQEQSSISGGSGHDAPNYSQIRVVGLSPAQSGGVPTMPPASTLAMPVVQSRPSVAR